MPGECVKDARGTVCDLAQFYLILVITINDLAAVNNHKSREQVNISSIVYSSQIQLKHIILCSMMLYICNRCIACTNKGDDDNCHQKNTPFSSVVDFLMRDEFCLEHRKSKSICRRNQSYNRLWRMCEHVRL